MSFKIIPAVCERCGKKTVIRGDEKEVLCYDCFDEKRRSEKIDRDAEQFLKTRKKG